MSTPENPDNPQRDGADGKPSSGKKRKNFHLKKVMRWLQDPIIQNHLVDNNQDVLLKTYGVELHSGPKGSPMSQPPSADFPHEHHQVQISGPSSHSSIMPPPAIATEYHPDARFGGPAGAAPSMHSWPHPHHTTGSGSGPVDFARYGPHLGGMQYRGNVRGREAARRYHSPGRSPTRSWGRAGGDEPSWMELQRRNLAAKKVEMRQAAERLGGPWKLPEGAIPPEGTSQPPAPPQGGYTFSAARAGSGPHLHWRGGMAAGGQQQGESSGGEAPAQGWAQLSPGGSRERSVRQLQRRFQAAQLMQQSPRSYDQDRMSLAISSVPSVSDQAEVGAFGQQHGSSVQPQMGEDPADLDDHLSIRSKRYRYSSPSTEGAPRQLSPLSDTATAGIGRWGRGHFAVVDRDEWHGPDDTLPDWPPAPRSFHGTDIPLGTSHSPKPGSKAPATLEVRKARLKADITYMLQGTERALSRSPRASGGNSGPFDSCHPARAAAQPTFPTSPGVWRESLSDHHGTHSGRPVHPPDTAQQQGGLPPRTPSGAGARGASMGSAAWRSFQGGIQDPWGGESQPDFGGQQLHTRESHPASRAHSYTAQTGERRTPQPPPERRGDARELVGVDTPALPRVGVGEVSSAWLQQMEQQQKQQQQQQHAGLKQPQPIQPPPPRQPPWQQQQPQQEDKTLPNLNSGDVDRALEEFGQDLHLVDKYLDLNDSLDLQDMEML